MQCVRQLRAAPPCDRVGYGWCADSISPAQQQLHVRHTHTAVSSLHLLVTFAVLWLDQVHSKHLAQVLIAQPHGDSGLEEPERFAGHEIDALLVPCSQRARKWRQRQLAQLRSAPSVAAEADLQPVTALGKLAAVSMHVSVRSDSRCSVAVLRLRPSFAEARRFRATLPSHMCRSPCMRVERVVPNQMRASNQAPVTLACPRSTGARGRTLMTLLPSQRFVTACNMQHTTCEFQRAACKHAPSNMQEVPHSTNKHWCSHATL
jgi:hypothetical protein